MEDGRIDELEPTVTLTFMEESIIQYPATLKYRGTKKHVNVP